jgi:hypothetical protein
MRLALTSCGLIIIAILVGLGGLGVANAQFEIQEFDGEVLRADGSAEIQAGSHPSSATVSFKLGGQPAEQLRDVRVELPPGFIGNPTAVDECRFEELAREGNLQAATRKEPLLHCPRGAQVGVVVVRDSNGQAGGGGGATFWDVQPIYSMVPPPDAPAQFAFAAGVFEGGPIVVMTPEVRTGGDYGLTVRSEGASQVTEIGEVEATFWGNPPDSTHDSERGYSVFGALFCSDSVGIPSAGCPAEAVARPFLTNPTDCSTGPARTHLEVTSWQGSTDSAFFDSHLADDPETAEDESEVLAGPTGCELIEFEPTMKARSATPQPNQPSGYEIELRVPQNESTSGLGTAQLEKAVVRMPAGMRINPAQAHGLGACSSAQIGIDNDKGATCPDSSKVGTLEVVTPLLEEPMNGSVYVAKQGDHPFDSLLAIYFVVEGPGVLVKLAGKIDLDPQTGQITATFDDSPPLPFSSLKVRFKGGPGAALINPAECGTHAIASEMTPNSAFPEPPAPRVADPGRVATLSASFEIEPGNGTSCAPRGFSPGFGTGTENAVAGAFSDFGLQFDRSDADQEFDTLEVSLPEGLTGKLAGVEICPQAAIDAAKGMIQAGQGALELATPSCPASSQLGSVVAGAGAGPDPYYVNTGKVYLAGPYKGAPLSLAFVTPAVAGPFDLGNVVVQTGAYVDPATARITAKADPLPRILHGIPLGLRDVRVSLDRPGFVRNPTSCAEKGIGSIVRSTQGATAELSQRFQVGDCAALGFRPRISLRLFGGTRRAQYQGLRAVVRPRAGDANIGRTVVRMPRSAFLAQEHLKNICTRVQWAADACPESSVYGKAIAYSPLLDQPLKGNVHLRSSNNKLPDLVADLRGPEHQPIRIELVGRTDSVKGALRNTFDVVPDAPVSYFRLQLFGGDKGLIVNSTDICKRKNRAAVRMDAQNGRRVTTRPVLRNTRCMKQRPAKRKAKRSAHRSRVGSSSSTRR